MHHRYYCSLTLLLLLFLLLFLLLLLLLLLLFSLDRVQKPSLISKISRVRVRVAG